MAMMTAAAQKPPAISALDKAALEPYLRHLFVRMRPGVPGVRD